MILKLRGGQQVEQRAFALTDMVKWGYNDLRNIGGYSSEKEVRGVPAIHRAAKIRAEAVASLRVACWQGPRAAPQRVDAGWQARLFAQTPNEWQSRFGFWETVGESLAYRGNAYIWKLVDPNSLRVFEWYALHPDQVHCKGAGRYEVTVRDGFIDPVGRGEGKYEVDDDTMIHVRGHGNGGTWEAPSPIKVFRDALTAPVARQRHENRMWRRGTSLQLAVSFPPGITKEQIDEWRPAWQESYEGADGGTTAVVGGGAEIKPIGMTAADAEFVALANLTIQDASMIMGPPAGLIAKRQGERAPAGALEEDLTMWMRFGLGPELERIANTLESDTTLFPSQGRSIYPGFDTSSFALGSIATEDAVAHQQVQDGRLLVDEWRARQGLPPLPNGAGAVPQITPVGGAPNPNKQPVAA